MERKEGEGVRRPRTRTKAKEKVGREIGGLSLNPSSLDRGRALKACHHPILEMELRDESVARV